VASRALAILRLVRPVRTGPKAGRALRYSLVLIALPVAFFASGCGETVIDSAKLEDTISANVEKSLHEKVTSVDCPSHQKVEPGSTFTCTIEFSNGKHATSTWKIRNEEADVSLIGFEKTE
jgi:hypothetical protein